MREFIYLSDGKLRQFLPEPSRLPRAGALRLTTPLGGLDFDAPAADDGDPGRLRHLRLVTKHLQRQARWFSEAGLRPGQWVRFEAPLSWVTLRGEYQSMVLFVDPEPGTDPAYQQRQECRLLMHGSAHHLLGLSPAVVDGPRLTERRRVVGCSGGGGDSGGSSFGSYVTFVASTTRAGHAVQTLSQDCDPIADDTEGEEDEEGAAGGEQEPEEASVARAVPAAVPAAAAVGLRDGVRDLLHALDAERAAQGEIGIGPWTRGYARVTAEIPADETTPRCLVASPLTVEYAPDLA